MSQEQAVFQWAWVGARKDHPEFERFRLSANESLITAWVTSQGLTVNPATLTVALEEAVRSGCLPNGVRLAQRTTQRIVEDEQAKQAAEAAAAAEKQRQDEIAEENLRFGLIEFIVSVKFANLDDHARSIEKQRITYWPTQRLQQEADALKLKQAWKGRSAEDFKAGVLDPARAVTKPGALKLPDDLTYASYRLMTPGQIKDLVGRLSRKHQVTQQQVYNAINERMAATRGAGV